MLPLIVSASVAILGGILLLISSRTGGRQSSYIAAALLSANNKVGEGIDSWEDSAGSTFNTRSTGQHLQEEFRQRPYLITRVQMWFVAGVVFTAGRYMWLGFSTGGVALSLALGVIAGELYLSQRLKHLANREVRRLEFHLPIAMERLVIGVGAGLDIITAMRESGRYSTDPVSALLSRIVILAESGTPVESAFSIVSKEIQSPAIKHALIHLALAHRQGGEVIVPLKELSDATQLAYQEGIEEQIAKLPVKAVLPLVLTFTGLIICFLTVPLVQFGNMSRQVVDAVR